MNQDRYRHRGIIVRTGKRASTAGRSMRVVAQQGVAKHLRLLETLLDRCRRLGGRYCAQLAGIMSKTQDGFSIKTSVNPHGLHPTVTCDVKAAGRKFIDIVPGLAAFADYNIDGTPDVVFWGDSAGQVWRGIIADWDLVDTCTSGTANVGESGRACIGTNLYSYSLSEQRLFFQVPGVQTVISQRGSDMVMSFLNGVYEKPQISAHPTGLGAVINVVKGLRGGKERGSIYGLWDYYGTVVIPIQIGTLLERTVTFEGLHASENSYGRVTSSDTLTWDTDARVGWYFNFPEKEYLAEPIDMWAQGSPAYLRYGGDANSNFYRNAFNFLAFHTRTTEDPVNEWLGYLNARTGAPGGTSIIDFNRDGNFTSGDEFSGNVGSMVKIN